MRWYALRSKAHKEDALWRELGARGHEAFYPRLQVQPVNSRSRKTRPYFPGYLFVRTQLDDVGASAFAWLPYGQGLVSFGGEPAPIPDELVEAIRRRVQQTNAAGGEQLVRLRRGDDVIIRDGLFEGYHAIFDTRVAGTERVRVLLRLLEGRQLQLDLPVEQIEQIRRR